MDDAGAGRAAFWHVLGRQLANPKGAAGRIAGVAMRLANKVPNALAVNALEISSTDVALDLGCGPGQALALMARRACQGVVHGIDRSPTMVAQAARANRAAIKRGRIVVTRGDFDRLPYRSGSIDKILASNVAYFWHDAPAVLSEVGRVLSPGGRLAVYVTDAATMGRWKFAGTGTHLLFDASGLRRLLLEGGFDAERIAVAPVALFGGVRGLLATASSKS